METNNNTIKVINAKSGLTISNNKNAKQLHFIKDSDSEQILVSYENKVTLITIDEDNILPSDGIKISTKLYNYLETVQSDNFKDITDDIKESLVENQALMFSVENHTNKKQVRVLAKQDENIALFDAYRESFLNLYRFQLNNIKSNETVSLSELASKLLSIINKDVYSDYKALIHLLENGILLSSLRVTSDIDSINAGIIGMKTISDKNMKSIIADIKNVSYILENGSKKQAKQASNKNSDSIKSMKKTISDKIALDNSMKLVVTAGMNVSEDIKQANIA